MNQTQNVDDILTHNRLHNIILSENIYLDDGREHVI